MTKTAALLLALLGFASTRAEAQISSGPKAGAKAEAFSVYVATGDLAGKKADFLADREGKPTVFLFVKASKWDRPMARFLGGVDREIVRGIEGATDATAVAIWLTEDKEASKEYLPVAQQSLKLDRTTFAVFEGDPSGPNGWEVNGQAHLTAIVVKNGKVVESFGYTSLNETDVPDVVKALGKP